MIGAFLERQGLRLFSTALVIALASALTFYVKLVKSERVVAEVRAELKAKDAAMDRDRAEHAMALVRLSERLAEAQLKHAVIQQEIAHDLSTAKAAVAAADVRLGAMSGRLRDTAAALDAALAAKAHAGPAAAGGACDRHEAELRLLAEGGRLLARSGELAAEGRRLVAGRDAEVRALADLVSADRVLMQDGGPRPNESDGPGHSSDGASAARSVMAAEDFQ